MLTDEYVIGTERANARKAVAVALNLAG
eukprot:SAG31_NODE_43638_length_266_cov_0.622754_1_plen_27_part_10